MVFVAVVFGSVVMMDVFWYGYGLRMNGGADLLNDGVKAVVVVGGVLDNSHGAVGLVDAVRAMDNVAVTDLMLRFHVTGVGIVHAVVEGVLRMRLKKKRKYLRI